LNAPTTATQSPAVQDYLRAIYQLATQGSGRRVTTSQLARRLAVRPASVTAMLQKMAAATPALVDYHKSRGARLTADGQAAALAVVRSHRLLELFLHEKLGFGWDEVHEEADRLEHVVGEAMIARMDEALGHPTRDPHGHAIPAADLALDATAVVPLSHLAESETAVIQFVGDENAELLRYLEAVGLRPGVTVEVTRREATEGFLWLSLGGEPLPLGLVAAGQIYTVAPVRQPAQRTG
jgi:DtxR family Mn-dependent transcriptional regulator